MILKNSTEKHPDMFDVLSNGCGAGPFVLLSSSDARYIKLKKAPITKISFYCVLSCFFDHRLVLVHS